MAVHRLPFTKFTGSSSKLLTVIAGWAGEAIHNARAGVRFKALEEDMANTLTPHFFKRRIKEEILRVKRHPEHHMALMVVRVEAAESVADEARIAEQAVSMILRSTCSAPTSSATIARTAWPCCSSISLPRSRPRCASGSSASFSTTCLTGCRHSAR